MSIANIREKLDDLEQWMERLQDLGVVEVGQHIEMTIDLITDGIQELIEHYRGLVEKAEKEMVK